MGLPLWHLSPPRSRPLRLKPKLNPTVDTALAMEELSGPSPHLSQPTTTATAMDTTATPTPPSHLTPATPAMTTPAPTSDSATATTTAATDTTAEDTTTERGTQAELVSTTAPTGPTHTAPTEAHTEPPTAVDGECTPFGVRVDSLSRILAHAPVNRAISMLRSV